MGGRKRVDSDSNDEHERCETRIASDRIRNHKDHGCIRRAEEALKMAREELKLHVKERISKLHNVNRELKKIAKAL